MWRPPGACAFVITTHAPFAVCEGPATRGSLHGNWPARVPGFFFFPGSPGYAYHCTSISAILGVGRSPPQEPVSVRGAPATAFCRPPVAEAALHVSWAPVTRRGIDDPEHPPHDVSLLPRPTEIQNQSVRVCLAALPTATCRVPHPITLADPRS